MDLWLPPKPAIIIPKPVIIRPVDFAPAWLPGICVPFKPEEAGAPTPPSNDFRTSANITTNGTSFNFGSLDIGAADATRIVIVGLRANASADPTSLTVAGNAATSRVSVNHSGIVRSIFYSIAEPSGTTANVTATFAASAGNCSVGIWRLINAVNSAPNFTATDNTISANALSANIDIPSNGSLFALVTHNDGSSPRTFTWTNATERFDATSEGVDAYSGASETGLGSQSGRTVTATASGGFAPIGCLALMSWN